MADSIPSPSHNVHTTLNYYIPLGPDPPFHYVDKPPPGKPEHNIGLEAKPVVIHDARGHESEFTLDKNGFQFMKHVSQYLDFDDKEKIQSVYYKEVEELVKRELGARKVFVFDHTLRRNFVKFDGPSHLYRGPVERVHIDQTYEASVQRVHRHFPEDAPRLLSDRVRIINIWRPIGHPVYHRPLAVSDWRKLDQEKDLVTIRYIFPDRESSTFSVRYNPEHEWWHLAHQTPEEVTLIKCFDSKVDRARLTPHSAFVDKTSAKDTPMRESIEVRCLVFDIE